MDIKTLTLSLKKQWFDMINDGVKKEEYREICDYWGVRFAGRDVWANEFCIKDVSEIELKRFDRLVFTLGYPKADDTERRLVLKNPKIRVGTGRPEWGAEHGKLYFVISWEE
jgi:hypothetical protein